MNSTKRYLCADFLACLGAVFLLALQYIQATGFLDQPVTYESTPHVATRWICLSGAMLLSACVGFVMSEKTLSWHSFKPFLRLGYIYIICSLCAMLMQKMIFDQEITFQILLQMLYQFSVTDTAKFIAMYFALLFAAPFLSAAFRELKTYQARLAFLIISAGVSTLQPMLIISGNYLLPEWCKMLAPIAGFVGGAFLKYYAKHHSKIFWFFMLLLVCVLQTIAVMAICTEKGCLYYPQFDSMASFPSLLIALFILSLFRSEKRGDSGLHSFFAGASGGALCALILGDTMIDFLMPSIIENFPDMKNLLFVGFLAVPVIFILCCTIGLFLQIPVFIINSVITDMNTEDDDEEETSTTQKPKPIRKLEPISKPVSEPAPVSEPISKSIPEPAPIPEPISKPIPEPVPIPEPISKPIPEPASILESISRQKKSESQVSLQEILKEKKSPAQDIQDKLSIDELIAKITK
ncbi:MAG: hypothetical protein K2O52_00815 [Oscillospiraceae bacterium]|nr:hypothetical protein [Oscillospiraceae bacterium]